MACRTLGPTGLQVSRIVFGATAVGGVVQAGPGDAARSGSKYEISLRFVLMKEGVGGTLIGFSTPEHIDRAIEVMHMPPLPQEVMALLERMYASEPFSSAKHLENTEYKEQV